MEFLLNRFRNLTVLLLVILAQLVLLAYQVKSNQDVRMIRVWSVTAITPIARVLEFVRRNTIGVVEDYFVLVNVREQNRKLNDDLGRLKMDNQFLQTELQTADRARALGAFQARTPSRTIPARIIGTGTGTNSRVVFVDQGSSQGVVRGMAVVTPDGIVGRVLAAFPTASQVLLITDPTFAAGAISDKNRVHGTVKGLGQGKCRVDHVENEEKVEVGEMFYTSGEDRVFPKGMPVGKVTVVRQGSEFKEIFIVPSGFQQGLEEVLIVIEGVHQALPENEPAAPGFYILPPVISGQPTPAPTIPSAVATEADRMRERYKRIGEAQGIPYGEGFRSPDFNADPAKPQPAATPPAKPKPQTPAPTTATPLAKPKPQTPAPTAETPLAKPKPQTPTVEQALPPASSTTPPANP